MLANYQYTIMILYHPITLLYWYFTPLRQPNIPFTMNIFYFMATMHRHSINISVNITMIISHLSLPFIPIGFIIYHHQLVLFSNSICHAIDDLYCSISSNCLIFLYFTEILPLFIYNYPSINDFHVTLHPSSCFAYRLNIHIIYLFITLYFIYSTLFIYIISSFFHTIPVIQIHIIILTILHLLFDFRSYSTWYILCLLVYFTLSLEHHV